MFPAEDALPAKDAVFEGHTAGNRRKLQEGFRALESRVPAYFHKESEGWPRKRAF